MAEEKAELGAVLHFDGSAAALRRDHLFHHLTDGRWHDDCALCLDRRRHGGTGLPAGGEDRG